MFKNMATVTLTYDGRNRTIRRMLDALLSLGVTVEKTEKKQKKLTPLEEADEDIKQGRVYSAKNAEDLFNKLMNV
jgi:16S rRNA U516 pseudouridylate synthase RsuA-like enzyme